MKMQRRFNQNLLQIKLYGDFNIFSRRRQRVRYFLLINKKENQSSFGQRETICSFDNHCQ